MAGFAQSPERLGRSFFIFSCIQIIFLCAVLSGAASQFGGLIGRGLAAQPESSVYAAIYAAGLAALSPVLLIGSMTAADAIRAGKHWARPAVVLTAIFALLEFPIGSAFGIYWVSLLRKRPRIL